MATITLRAVKGSPLTNAEVDANFTNLNTELGGKADSSSLSAVAISGAYSDLTGKPVNVSSFTNDSGYITSASSITGTASNVTGTVAVANGGTGATSLTSGYLVKGNGTSAASASVVYDNGTNVGIGTSAPSRKLTVVGETLGTPTLGTGSGGFFLSSINGLYGLYGGNNGSTGDAWLQAMRNDAATAYNILLNPAGGNVGIGTSSPAGKLHVASGRIFLDADFSVSWQSGGVNRSRIVGDNVNSIIFENGSGNTERMRITDTGNVGIGTSAPEVKVHAVSASGNVGLFDSTDTTSGAKALAIRSTAVSGTAVPTLAMRQWRTNFAGGYDVGQIRFDGLTTSGAYTEFAGIYAAAGTNTASGAPTSIAFRTTNSAYVSAERMRLDNEGNLGIGTASPSHKLDAQGTGSVYVRARSLDTTGGAVGYVGAEFAGGSVLQMRAGSNYTVLMSTGAYDPLLFSTNATERMRIDSSGNVGIGTSAPSSYGKLTVNGNIVFGAPGGRNAAFTNNIGIWTTGDPVDDTRANIGFTTVAGASSSSSYITFATNNYGVSGGERMRIDSSGNVGIGLSNPGYPFTVQANSATQCIRLVGRAADSISTMEFTNSAQTVTQGYIQSNGNNLLFATGTTEKARIDSAGNVGIGTTAPATKLDVNGAFANNIVSVAASAIDCSAGNYFIKTATGALTWTVTNVPANRAYSFILELTNGGTGTQTWFSGIKWPGGTAPTLTASGVDVLGFITDDGGTTWRGVQLMKDSK